MGLEQIIAENAWVFTLVAILVIPIKGFALWTAAKRDEKWWFIALVVVNSLAILEIVYLLAIVKIHKKKSQETAEAVKVDAPAPETEAPATE